MAEPELRDRGNRESALLAEPEFQNKRLAAEATIRRFEDTKGSAVRVLIEHLPGLRDQQEEALNILPNEYDEPLEIRTEQETEGLRFQDQALEAKLHDVEEKVL